MKLNLSNVDRKDSDTSMSGMSGSTKNGCGLDNINRDIKKLDVDIDLMFTQCDDLKFVRLPDHPESAEALKRQLRADSIRDVKFVDDIYRA